ncbi:MAG: hypothetical protein ACPG7F_14135 [Aggregatilineales bacterium]
MSTSNTNTAPPPGLPEQPALSRRSRYQRRRRFFSGWGLLIGLILGIGGGVFAAWELFPVVEQDTTPRQLSATAKQDYAVAIMLAYSFDGDLGNAVTRLTQLFPNQDPIQAVADVACDLAKQGDVVSTGRLRSVRALKTFYQLQGRSGCADTLIPDVEQGVQIVEVDVPTETPTIPPPPTKTPTGIPERPTSTPAGVVIEPSSIPRRDYTGRLLPAFCDEELSGVIEVFVNDFRGDGVAGERIRVRWDGGEDTFMSGLKPERGPSYADFQMVTGRSYIIDMPERADPLSLSIVAEPCFTGSGDEAIKSYRVVFTQSG